MQFESGHFVQFDYSVGLRAFSLRACSLKVFQYHHINFVDIFANNFNYQSLTCFLIVIG